MPCEPPCQLRDDPMDPLGACGDPCAAAPNDCPPCEAPGASPGSSDGCLPDDPCTLDAMLCEVPPCRMFDTPDAVPEPPFVDGQDPPECLRTEEPPVDLLRCINTDGQDVDWNYIVPPMPGVNYKVWVLEELVSGTDFQKDIRVGWHNDYQNSYKGVPIKFRTNAMQCTGWYTVATSMTSTPPCGEFLKETGGNEVAFAIVDLEVHFSGMDVTTTEATSSSRTTSTTATTTVGDTWTTEVSVTVTPRGGGAGSSASQTHSQTFSSSYSQTRSDTTQWGNTVTRTAYRTDFGMHNHPVG